MAETDTAEQVDVVMRKKSESSGRAARDQKDLSIIDEERLSLMLFEEAELAAAVAANSDIDNNIIYSQSKSNTIVPIMAEQSSCTLTQSKIPLIKPTAVKGILKTSKGQDGSVTDSSAVNLQANMVSRTHGGSKENKMPQPAAVASDEESGLENLERSIREADLAVRQAMNYKEEEDRHKIGMSYVDIDIGEANASTKGGIDNTDTSTTYKNTLHDKANSDEILSSNTRHLQTYNHKIVPLVTTSNTAFSSNLHHQNQQHQHNDVMTRSAPPEMFTRPSPSSTPESGKHIMSPPSSGSYVFTSHTLPLQSPSDSPRHRLSQSGSPISPASGHQTVVYVPIVMNNCKCCSGHNSESFRDIVVRHTHRSRKDSDQMSMASSIDSEVARYLIDNRSETSSNIDVLESTSVINLSREDRIQKALMVNHLAEFITTLSCLIGHSIVVSCIFTLSPSSLPVHST